MMEASTRDKRLVWLGGEAHVRRQDERRLWRLPRAWREGVYVIGALLSGSAIGGGVATLACRQRSSQTSAPKDKGEPPMHVDPPGPRHQSPTETLFLAFAAGAAVGAGLAFLTTPQAGHEMRRRLARGAKTAQEELTEVAEETRDAVGALTKDARQTLRRTACRLTEVVAATMDSLKAEPGAPETTRADE